MLPLILLFQLPKIASSIWHEHKWLAKKCLELKPDLIISDNRFGFHNENHKSIFITHQLTIKAPYPWVERAIQKINYRFIQNYSACWVPDCEGNINVAGILSHPLIKPKIPTYYMGLLARFPTNTVPRPNNLYLYKYACILSGPEPQRTMLENILTNGFANTKEKTVIIRGTEKPTIQAPVKNDNLFIYNRLLGNDLLEIMLQSEYILCRGGYTTVMELFALHKKAIFIPTPGQTEQEYLCERLMNLGYAYYMPQDCLDLKELLSNANQFPYKLHTFTFFKESDMQCLLKKLS